MAGGKETPRQKMIGMMYLVLMAILALNVSKEIINAFVTLNNKVDKANNLLDRKNNDVLGLFDQKITTLEQTDPESGDLKTLRELKTKAIEVRWLSNSICNYLTDETGEMIS